MQSVNYAECHLCRVLVMVNVIMLSASYAQSHKQVLYVECHYAECRGVITS